MNTQSETGKDKPELVLVDGSGYIFRAFFALKTNLTSPDGTPVNAVFGFTKMLLKLLDDLQPQTMAVIFDAGRATFRNDIYADYKANRSEPPEDLVPQFDLVRTATRALGLPLLEMPGWEADDLIATLARQARAAGQPCLVVSSDKDLMQLVGDGLQMLDPMKNRRVGEAEVIEKFGVPPEKVVDVQALAGDSSDNVPGVPGIGIKTAAELINQFGDLDSLLARAGEITQPKRRESLIQFADQARLSRQLVRLADNVPIEGGLDALNLPPRDDARLAGFLADMGFRSLLASLGLEMPAGQQLASSPVGATGEAGASAPGQPDMLLPPVVTAPDYQLVTETAQLAGLLQEARAQGFMAVDTETSSLNAAAGQLVGLAFALAPGRAFYVPLRHVAAGSMADASGQTGLDFEAMPAAPPPQIPLDAALALIKPVLEDPSILKIGHNLKYDSHILSRAENGGITLDPVDDTMCLSFVLDAGRVDRHGLDYLAMHWLQVQTVKYEDLCGKGASQIPFAQTDPAAACAYAAEDADISLRLWQMLKPRLAREGMASVYERLERPLISVLAVMEAAGICVDTAILRRLSNDFAQRMDRLESEIHAAAGQPFNVASPKQLGDILFDQMGLAGGKKSKTGAFSTDANVLEDLAAQGVGIARLVLDYRQLAKLKSTYTDALIASVLPATGRVHTSFSMVGAATGRLSSSDPNLQNIPIRTQEGRSIRTAFVAKPGHLLLSADYSQIELRLVAHVAGEQSMIEAFHKGIDIHAQTAAEVFNVALDQMDSETRRRAKAINFGIIYGISGFGLARQLGIPQSEARDYISAYLQRFPGIKSYMDQIKEQARETGFVETLFGRRLHVSGLTSSNPAQRGFAERQAINAPIQGSAADIIKRAMCRLPDALAAAGLSARMLLQVHDELIFEVEEAQADETAKLVCAVMEGAAEPVLALSVPLIAEAGLAQSWAGAH